MVVPLAYAASRRQRTPPSLPFGWGAVTVLLVGAVFLIIGIVIILYGFIGFFTGTIGNATSGSFSIGSFFSSFFGAIILFVVGGVLAGVGGWLVRLWWLFLLVGVVTGAGSTGNTVREREAMRGSDVRIRCRACSRLNPEEARFCLSCGQAI
jgi:hypothetical protein